MFSPCQMTNQQLVQAEGIRTNWQYRTFIQTHPELDKINMERTILSTGAPIVRSAPTGLTMPYLYTNTFDNSRPPIGYCDSLSKRQFLEEERHQARMISVAVPRTQQW